jgi:hypothetical protein
MSIYDYISSQLTADGLSWNLAYGFKDVYTTTLPVICIRTNTKTFNPVEIGSVQTTKDYSVYLDIFASNEDEKNNIKDWLSDVLQSGCDYFTYIINDSGVAVATSTSYKIVTLNITEVAINLDTDKSNLDEHDRYRFRLNLNVTTGEVS